MHLKRIALVVGNGTYTDPVLTLLKNAVPDAQRIANDLKDRGFETELHTDIGATEMSDAISSFCESLSQTPCFSVFYYAGHGCEQHGLTYLYPTDMPGDSPSLIPQYGISITDILKESEHQSAPRILILDCCRTNEASWTSDERTRFEEKAVAANHRAGNTLANSLIAYSTSAGQSAFDGSGDNGPYCEQLSWLLLKHRLTVEDVFKDVGMLVSSKSHGKQRPWFYSNLSSDLTFSDVPSVEATITVETTLSDGTRGLIKEPSTSRVIAYQEGHSKARCIDGVAVQGDYEFNGPVQLMTTWKNGLIVYDNKGSLWKEEDGLYLEVQLDIETPLFIVSSLCGKYMIFGGTSGFHTLDMNRTKRYHIQTINTSFYSAVFVGETQAWIIGSSGEIREITFGDDEPIIKEVKIGTRELLYSICRIDDTHVAISGSNGKVYKVSLSEKSIVWTCALGDTVRTPAARMQSVFNIVSDNQIIRSFLFDPQSLPNVKIYELENELTSNNLLFSASSTSSPILVVASNEGLLYLIDHRDGGKIEVIDNAAGRAIGIEGITFLDDHQFAVLDQKGAVRFYSLATVPYETALRYVDKVEFDASDVMSP